ncbi:MAG: uracil-DNA glycosylase [Polymorphobacter sp.]
MQQTLTQSSAALALASCDASALASSDASALAWLVGAGVDTLVSDTPRNWLAPPVAAPMRAPVMQRPTAAPVAAAAAPASIAPDIAAATDLAALDILLRDFAHPLRRVDVSPQLLTGAIDSGVVVLGDHPDAADTPAGLLAMRMLAAIGIAAGGCAHAHLIPWSTPGARPARDDEIAAFAPFRRRALALARPRLILAFGDRAAALSGAARGLASTRGKWQAVDDVPMLATFHPRTLLAQPELKRLAWADLQAFAARINTP